MKYFSMYFSAASFTYLGYLFYLQSKGEAEISSILLCYVIAISFALAEHLKTVEKKIIHSNAMVIGTFCAIVFNRTFHASSDEESVIRAYSGLVLLGSILWIICEWGDAKDDSIKLPN